jgi:hypothetical protein
MIRINQALFAGSLLSALFAAGGAAAAGPSLESACTVKLPPNSTSGAYASEDCKQVFVTPPAVGKARVSAVAPKQNLDFCPAVKKVGEVASTTLSAAATIAVKIQKMITDFDPLSKEIDTLNAKWIEANRVRDIAQATMDNAETTKSTLITAVTTAKSDLDLCLILNPDCSTQQAAYTAAVTELRAFVVATYAPAQQALITAKANSDAALAAYTRKTSDLVNALTPLFDLQNKLFELNVNVNTLYNQYIRLSGFTGSMLYSTTWSQAINDFQTANAGKSVVRMPIKRPRLAAAAIGVEGYTTDTPSILGFAIPGVVAGKSIDLMSMPLGTESMPKLTDQLDPSIQYEGVFGDSVSAQVNVSLMGACPFYPTGLAGGVQGDLNDLTAEVAMNAFYSYDLAVRRGYEASYNLAMWAKRVETIKKKGGFFSSKTLHEIVEDSSSSDWFSIKFTGNSGFTYTTAEQARITREVKGQLQERALLLLAIQMNVLPSGAKPGTIPPQPTGAGTAAAYLMNGCGYWSWCLAGSFVLGVLDSIFGSSTAVSSFEKSNNVWVKEVVSGIAFNEQAGAMSYAK